MVALKKAYAEMILNTAKEAASQVMASEKKAFRYQQDLLTTKEEALRLLVRLKQMIDAKVIPQKPKIKNKNNNNVLMLILLNILFSLFSVFVITMFLDAIDCETFCFSIFPFLKSKLYRLCLYLIRSI